MVFALLAGLLSAATGVAQESGAQASAETRVFEALSQANEVEELARRERTLEEDLILFEASVLRHGDEARLLEEISARLERRGSPGGVMDPAMIQVEVATERGAQEVFAALIRQGRIELEEVRRRQDELRGEAEQFDNIHTRKIAREERLQAEARQAIEESHRQEGLEPNEEVRRLLAQERMLTKELLAISEEDTERIRRRMQGQRQAVERHGQHRELIEEAVGRGETSDLDEAMRLALEFRREVRVDLRQAQAELSKARRDFHRAQEELPFVEAEQRSLVKEIGNAHEASDLARQRLRVAQVKVDVASRRLATAEAALEAAQDDHRLLVQRVRFFRDTVAALYGEISPGLRREIRSVQREEGWRDVAAGLHEVTGRVTRLLQERREWLEEIGEKATSIAFWGVLISILWRLMVVLVLIWIIRRDGPRALHSGVNFLLRRPFFRRRAAATIKLAELFRALLIPAVLYGCAKWIVGFLAPIFVELTYLEWLVDIAAIYWIVLTAVQVMVLPRWQREEERLGPAPDLAGLTQGREGLDAFIEVARLERTRGRRMVRSVRLILSFWLLMVYLPQAFWVTLGPSPLWWLVHQATIIALIIACYVVLSWWKADLAAVFSGLAGDRMPRAAEAVQKHKDRAYGVLVIAGVALFAVVSKGLRLARTWLVDREWNRQVSNFLFRKKIEIQQRNRDLAGGHQLGESAAGIPESYQALFASAPLWDEPYLLHRQEQMEEIVEAFESWRDDRRKGGMAIVGEVGLGRTTLLNQVVRQDVFAGSPLQFLTISDKVYERKEVLDLVAKLFGLKREQPWGLTELIEAINSIPSRVIIIDECEQLYMRQIGGFHGIDAFLDLVQRTSGRHFWVLSFRFFSWSYLNRVRPRSHYFAKVLMLSPWTKSELRELIRRRNVTVDLSVSFNELVVTHESHDRYYEVIQSARGYFRLLHEYAQGNPAVAQAFWLRSLRSDEEGRLQVGLFPRPSPAIITVLTDRYLFALAAIAQHGSLNAEEIARVINSDERFCATAVNFLIERGIVKIWPGDGRVRIRTDYIRLVMQHLLGANYLYK